MYKILFNEMSFPGAFGGTFIAMLISGVILRETVGLWAMIFYLYGTLSLIWLVAWILVGRSSPDDPQPSVEVDHPEQSSTASSPLKLSEVRTQSVSTEVLRCNCRVLSLGFEVWGSELPTLDLKIYYSDLRNGKDGWIKEGWS